MLKIKNYDIKNRKREIFKIELLSILRNNLKLILKAIISLFQKIWFKKIGEGNQNGYRVIFWCPSQAKDWQCVICEPPGPNVIEATSALVNVGAGDRLDHGTVSWLGIRKKVGLSLLPNWIGFSLVDNKRYAVSRAKKWKLKMILKF